MPHFFGSDWNVWPNADTLPMDHKTDKVGNKRQRKRIPLRYGIDTPGKIAFTDDISHEGLFIRTALALKPGTRLIVELTPPEGTIHLQAEVRWAKKVPSQMLHKLKGGLV